MSSPEMVEGFTLAPDEGEALWMNRARVVIKAPSERTGGRMAAVEFTAPKGFGSPQHIHRADDEIFVVISGDVRFKLGDSVVERTAGSMVFGPRGIGHAFMVDSEQARLLLVFGPAGTERLFREVGKPARGPGLPPPEAIEPMPDPQVMVEIAGRHGQDIIGPPLPSEA